MPETSATFRALGAEVTVSDAIAWGGEDIIVDLNAPLPRRLRGRYDVVVDPGTLEHCFNIAQAFENVDALLRPGGFVYHQDAFAFPNHGFWSISPTAFFDYYQSRGYELGVPYRFDGSFDDTGFIPRMKPISPFEADLTSPLPAIGIYTFRKTRATSKVLSPWPIQRCYSSLSRDIALTEFLQRPLEIIATRSSPE